MRIVTTVTKVYKFEELCDEAKEVALNNYREHGLCYEWWEATEDYFIECLDALGIRVEQCFFSGFGSQGDGASFNGTFSYRKDWQSRLRVYTTGGRIYEACIEAGQALEEVQARYMALPEDDRDADAIGCDIVVRRGHYCNSGVMDIEFIASTEEDGETILQALTELADSYFFALQDEWEYLTSEEAFRETADANGWDFTAFGRLF